MSDAFRLGENSSAVHDLLWRPLAYHETAAQVSAADVQTPNAHVDLLGVQIAEPSLTWIHESEHEHFIIQIRTRRKQKNHAGQEDSSDVYMD